jgi:hypothetical protein
MGSPTVNPRCFKLAFSARLESSVSFGVATDETILRAARQREMSLKLRMELPSVSRTGFRFEIRPYLPSVLAWSLAWIIDCIDTESI